MNSLHGVPTRILLFLSLVGFVGVSTTAAPLDRDTTPQAPSTTLVEYLRGELTARDEARTQRALADIIVLANCRASCAMAFQSIPDKMLRVDNEAGVGSAVDLTGITPDLLRVYQRAKMEGTQLLALAALIDIGNEKSLELLVATASTRSPRVARMTHQRVAAFFLGRYPELEERTLRTRMLALTDVEKARINQMRAQRNAAKRG